MHPEFEDARPCGLFILEEKYPEEKKTAATNQMVLDVAALPLRKALCPGLRFVLGRKLELLRDCGIGENFQFVHPFLSRAMEEINGWMDGPPSSS